MTVWDIMIDMSGTPQDDIYVGLILFTEGYKKRFLQEFHKKFPATMDYDTKSNQISNDTLYEILRFFDEKRLRMVCYHFKNFRWKEHERKLNSIIQEINPNHKYRTNFYSFREKIIGILYYYAITQIGLRGISYRVTVCHETHLNIWEVLKTVKKIAQRDSSDLRLGTNIRAVEHLLKMADYVAGANRHLELFKLEHIGHHTILNDPIRNIDVTSSPH